MSGRAWIAAAAALTAVGAGATTATAQSTDLLAGINWLQIAVASPCGDGTVQLIAGSSIDNGNRVVLDDVLPLHAEGGLAVAFLRCRGPGGAAVASTVSLVKVDASRVTASLAEFQLDPRSRIVAVDLPELTVETDVGDPPAGSCCAALVRRQRLRVELSGFRVVKQISAFEQTVNATPVVGGDGELVQRSVTPGALCYQWDNVWLSASEEAESAISQPSAELETIRLALIYLTGRWIEPASEMTAAMADVVTEFQQTRGLAVDGSIGEQTTGAIAAELGCPATGSFNMVKPLGLGPRTFGTVGELVPATQRFAQLGYSGNTALDELLRVAGWDGANALFLGCYRWEAPPVGMSCSWSGTTPLQLVGLVSDPAVVGVTDFSILYARSTVAAG